MLEERAEEEEGEKDPQVRIQASVVTPYFVISLRKYFRSISASRAAWEMFMLFFVSRATM